MSDTLWLVIIGGIGAYVVIVIVAFLWLTYFYERP